MAMQILRTPDERFANLPDYGFEPHYTEVPDGDGGTLRIHHVEQGDGPPVLLMHGEPTWSFLYRHMIPVLVAGGCRAVAPDLVGFGRSDKPAERDDYTYQRHVDWMSAWLEAVDLTDITLVCQDWGGLIGLRLAAAFPERFARLVVANTGMPTGDQPPSEAFLNWQNFSQTTPVFPVGMIINGGTVSDLAEDVVAGYDAPFPDEEYKAGARQFPKLVPTAPDDPASQANRDAWKVLEAFDKPVLTAFSDSDPITKGGFRVFQERVKGAQGQPHTTIEGGGHFLQEDQGPQLANVVLDFIRSTS
ncbi:MAG: haloalkane dehalogenase [Actinomycetota bacterium]|jgi:haloalkane dehalogenase